MGTEHLIIFINADYSKVIEGLGDCITISKKEETGEGSQYITNSFGKQIYHKFQDGNWKSYTKIPEEVLSFLFLSYPDLYIKVVKTFDL